MKYIILCLAAVAALVLLSGCSGGTKQEITYENLNSSDITLSVTQGTAADFAVSEKFPDTKIQYYSTIPDGCAAVKAGKTDGYSFDKVVLEYYAKKNPERIPGMISGRTTLTKAYTADAPKSCAASYTFLSSC